MVEAGLSVLALVVAAGVAVWQRRVVHELRAIRREIEGMRRNGRH